MAGAGTVRPHAAALLPHSRSVVGRRRAGRRQWTAGWALAGEPRSRRRDTPAATVRGAASTYWHPARLAAAHRRRPSLRRPARERRQRQSAPPAAARRVKVSQRPLGGSTALTWRHTWTRALRMCSVTRPSVGRGVNFGCTVKGHGRDAWCEHLDTTHRKIISRHGDGVSRARGDGRESETAAARPR